MIEKVEGKHITYFNADLVNSERWILQSGRNIRVSLRVNMVKTMSILSYGDTEEIEEEQDEDTDCEDS
jgi:hypothetical protein